MSQEGRRRAWRRRAPLEASPARLARDARVARNAAERAGLPTEVWDQLAGLWQTLADEQHETEGPPRPPRGGGGVDVVHGDRVHQRRVAPAGGGDAFVSALGDALCDPVGDAPDSILPPVTDGPAKRFPSPREMLTPRSFEDELRRITEECLAVDRVPPLLRDGCCTCPPCIRGERKRRADA